METIGAYEAKTHLPKLLERVAKGEHITFAKHGVPRSTFFFLLGQYGLSPFSETPDELEEDLVPARRKWPFPQPTKIWPLMRPLAISRKIGRLTGRHLWKIMMTKNNDLTTKNLEQLNKFLQRVQEDPALAAQMPNSAHIFHGTADDADLTQSNLKLAAKMLLGVT